MEIYLQLANALKERFRGIKKVDRRKYSHETIKYMLNFLCEWQCQHGTVSRSFYPVCRYEKCKWELRYRLDQNCYDWKLIPLSTVFEILKPALDRESSSTLRNASEWEILGLFKQSYYSKKPNLTQLEMENENTKFEIMVELKQSGYLSQFDCCGSLWMWEVNRR